ncbi:hypothetical protein Cob_v006659 [Colletotrichum orbiculare MAFF 240422]|uniref:Uncharacterized protein n=1 Tax=Colletotrichum orbiculare (strain 104-T / ATCC 96160 / CBS 514.97 / LARS 414 / MAFF 240422) TaxID=1213857 RepID=A0A484FSP4_COLOR|nr:hypothetical protein Cob_v006659 [Colletotrichum orbiculare MAFF 240422]
MSTQRIALSYFALWRLLRMCDIVSWAATGFIAVPVNWNIDCPPQRPSIPARWDGQVHRELTDVCGYCYSVPGEQFNQPRGAVAIKDSWEEARICAPT